MSTASLHNYLWVHKVEANMTNHCRRLTLSKTKGYNGGNKSPIRGENTPLSEGLCITVDQVPNQYEERYLVSGYRRPFSSFSDCIASIFRLNNETFNIWTHLLPLILFTFFIRRTFPTKIWPLSEMDSWYYPLLAEEISALASLLSSVVAHTFNCMTPRIRHTCFYIDYTAISMVGIGGACSTYYYLRPLNTEFFLFTMPNVYIGLCSICNILAVYLCCMSRHNWAESKYLVRTLAFTLPFIAGHFPSFYRVLQCVLTGGDCTTGLLYIVLGSTACLLAAILNSSRVPERYYSQTFDILGHSHQWMHITTTMGMFLHCWASHLDLEDRKDKMDELLEGITLNSSLGWVFGTLAVITTLALWFGSQLTTNGELRNKKTS